MSQVRSFFRYPGGKFKLRDNIINRITSLRLDDDTEFREPFYGGGSIGLLMIQDDPIKPVKKPKQAKTSKDGEREQESDRANAAAVQVTPKPRQKVKNIWINDKDVGIACLWTAVIRYPDDLSERVMKFTPTVDAFHDLKKELLGLAEMPSEQSGVVDIAFKKLAIHQTSYSGLGTMSGGPLGGEDQASDYKIDCRWSASHIRDKIQTLHTIFAKCQVRDQACTNRDFTSLIEGDGKCVIYLDPPYYEKGAELYQESFNEDDHRRLAAALKKTTHPWVLSYDDCPAVWRLYTGWSNVNSIQEVKYSITGTKSVDGKRQSRVKPELLICSKQGSDVIVPAVAEAVWSAEPENRISC